jgi:hypothetical protein
MKRKPSGRDLPTSAAMAAVLVVLAALYGAALAAPLWLWSVGFLPGITRSARTPLEAKKVTRRLAG